MSEVDRSRCERGSSLMLMPVAVLIFIILGAFAVDFSAARLARREMISAAQGGKHEDGRETYGHSLIVDPWGRVLADAGGAEPGVILAEIDLAAVADARARIPSLQHGRPFTVERVGTPGAATT